MKNFDDSKEAAIFLAGRREADRKKSGAGLLTREDRELSNHEGEFIIEEGLD